MKKWLAVLLVVVLIASMPLTAFAAKKGKLNSPTAGGKAYLAVVNYNGASAEVTSYNFVDKTTGTDNAIIEVITDQVVNGDTFSSFSFYDGNGEKAQEGVDYKIVNPPAPNGAGKVVMQVVLYNNLIVAANRIKPGETTETITTIDKALEELAEKAEKAPNMGDNTVVVMSLVMMVALAGVVVSKKQLAK